MEYVYTDRCKLCYLGPAWNKNLLYNFFGPPVSNLVEIVSEFKKTHLFVVVSLDSLRKNSWKLAQRWLIWQTPGSVQKGAPSSKDIASSRGASVTVITVGEWLVQHSAYWSCAWQHTEFYSTAPTRHKRRSLLKLRWFGWLPGIVRFSCLFTTLPVANCVASIGG